MRLVARQVATVVVVRDPGRRAATSTRGSPPDDARPGPAGARRRDRRRRPGRRPHRDRAGRHRRPAAAAATRRRRPARAPRRLARPAARRAWRCSTPAFAERVRPWPQIAQALLRRAGKRAGDLDVLRAIASPAAARGAAGAGAAGTSPRAGAASSPAASASPCRSPTGCSGSSSAPSARRSRTRWRGSPRRGSSRAAPTSGTCTARSSTTSRRSGGARDARHGHGARSPAVPATQLMLAHRVHARGRQRSERLLVHVLWMTSGLGCDGDTVAMTAATSPSLEDLLTGAIPGMPRRRHLQPAARLRDRRGVRAGVVRRRATARSTRSSSCSRARCPTSRSTATGHWAGVRRRPGDGPADHRPARGSTGWRRRRRRCMALGTCAAYGGDPGDEEQPDRARWACATTSAAAGPRGSGIPIVNLPGCPVQPDNITETLLAARAAARRHRRG